MSFVNAGSRARDDAIRSLVISYKLLGTREWFVIHHTNCGLVPANIGIYGYIYDVKSGRLLEVEEAKRPAEAAA